MHTYVRTCSRQYLRLHPLQCRSTLPSPHRTNEEEDSSRCLLRRLRTNVPAPALPADRRGRGGYRRDGASHTTNLVSKPRRLPATLARLHVLYRVYTTAAAGRRRGAIRVRSPLFLPSLPTAYWLVRSTFQATLWFAAWIKQENTAETTGPAGAVTFVLL